MQTMAPGYAHFSSYVTGYGGHVPSFGGLFMLVFVGYARKSELWPQVRPFFHRYAKLWSSFAIFVLAVRTKKKMSHTHARPLRRICIFYEVCMFFF